MQATSMVGRQWAPTSPHMVLNRLQGGAPLSLCAWSSPEGRKGRAVGARSDRRARSSSASLSAGGPASGPAAARPPPPAASAAAPIAAADADTDLNRWHASRGRSAPAALGGRPPSDTARAMAGGSAGRSAPPRNSRAPGAPNAKPAERAAAVREGSGASAAAGGGRGGVAARGGRACAALSKPLCAKRQSPPSRQKPVWWYLRARPLGQRPCSGSLACSMPFRLR